MENIEFEEWGGSRTLRLSERELTCLSAHARIFSVQPLRNQRYRISPRGGYVGSCLISPERQIVVRPKIAISNFYELIWSAYSLYGLPTLNTRAAFASGSPSDWFNFVILSEIDNLLRGQVRCGYVNVEEPLVFLRGRIQFSKPSLASAKLNCEYSDFRMDTAANQAVKRALEIIVDNGFDHPDIRFRAHGLLGQLADVSHVPVTAQSIDQIALDATQLAYKSVLQLIKLLLLGSGIDYEPGVTLAPGLFLPMDRIFERALFAVLRDEIGSSRVKYQPEIGSFISHISGEPNLKISMRPDVLTTHRPTALVTRDPSAVTFVIDAKYRPPLELGRFRNLSFRNANIYQIMTYAAALNCRGMLVYPRFDQDIEVSYQMGHVRFDIRTVDLDLPELGGLRSFARGIRRQLVA